MSFFSFLFLDTFVKALNESPENLQKLETKLELLGFCSLNTLVRIRINIVSLFFSMESVMDVKILSFLFHLWHT